MDGNSSVAFSGHDFVDHAKEHDLAWFPGWLYPAIRISRCFVSYVPACSAEIDVGTAPSLSYFVM